MIANRERAWNAVKGLVWKSACLAGEQWGNRAWIIYSLARGFINVKLRRTVVNEPEEEFVRRAVKAGQVCLDIGANVGTYTHLLSMLVGPHGLVHSIEPLPRAFAVLQQRVAVFHLDNVVCHAVALRDCEGSGEFVGGAGRPGTTSLAHLRAPGEEGVAGIQTLPMITLDRLVSAQGIDHIDFIKCDVEGAELLVFRGGESVLRRYRPVVLCEVQEQWMRYGYSTHEIFLFFRDLGYDSFVWREGSLSLADCLVTNVFNYIFLPQECKGEIVTHCWQGDKD